VKAKVAVLFTWVMPWVLGLFALWICNGVVYRAFGGGVKGFLCVLAGILLLPITAVGAPLYAGFKWGEWGPLVAVYSLALIAMALSYSGLFLLSRSWRDEGRTDDTRAEDKDENR